MLHLLCISVGLHRLGCTIIMEYLSIRWTKRCLVFSNIIFVKDSVSYLFSEALTICFLFPIAAIQKYAVEDIEKHPELKIISESDDSGVHIVMARGGREFFVTGHSEYSPYTLDSEYLRDVAKGLPIDIPKNYYVGDNPDNGPLVRWRSVANLLFSNWLNYYVYQTTPYDLEGTPF